MGYQTLHIQVTLLQLMTYAYLYQWENSVRECITAIKDASTVIQHVMHFSVAVC